VTRWKEVIRQRGVEGLKAKPATGRRSYLSERQKTELLKLLLRGARANGYATELWTCKRVAQTIWRRFRVRYNPNATWFVLRSLGWSPQKPQRVARERDERAIEQWRREDWPRIKKSPPNRPEHHFH
jgi:transposase